MKMLLYKEYFSKVIMFAVIIHEQYKHCHSPWQIQRSVLKFQINKKLPFWVLLSEKASEEGLD